MEESTNHFKYEALNPLANEIRLLILEPCSKIGSHTAVHCSLLNSCLDDPNRPSYEHSLMSGAMPQSPSQSCSKESHSESHELCGRRYDTWDWKTTGGPFGLMQSVSIKKTYKNVKSMWDACQRCIKMHCVVCCGWISHGRRSNTSCPIWKGIIRSAKMQLSILH